MRITCKGGFERGRSAAMIGATYVTLMKEGMEAGMNGTGVSFHYYLWSLFCAINIIKM